MIAAKSVSVAEINCYFCRAKTPGSCEVEQANDTSESNLSASSSFKTATSIGRQLKCCVFSSDSFGAGRAPQKGRRAIEKVVSAGENQPNQNRGGSSQLKVGHAGKETHDQRAPGSRQKRRATRIDTGVFPKTKGQS
jgi:hypothetical protein